jgi:hypothetical protein
MASKLICLASCSTEETDSMVLCDTCRRWYHYDCVGILPDAVPGEGEKWNCIDCRPGKGLASAVSHRQLCLKSVLEKMATMKQEIAARPSVSVPEGQQLVDVPPPAVPKPPSAPPPNLRPCRLPSPPSLPSAPTVSAAAAVPEDIIIVVPSSDPTRVSGQSKVGILILPPSSPTPPHPRMSMSPCGMG